MLRCLEPAQELIFSFKVKNIAARPLIKKYYMYKYNLSPEGVVRLRNAPSGERLV